MPDLRHDGSLPNAAERRRAITIRKRLVERYPDIRTALDFDSAWQLLVVTVLSAQTTDENVNRVRPVLFARYPTPADLAGANLVDVEEIVFSTGFYRQKAAAIVALAGDLVDRFGGVVPEDLDALTSLKGVGRKTASVVLGEAFGRPSIAVDTHVKRVAGRLGLSDATDPVKIERDLAALYKPSERLGLSMRIIRFGRETCTARSPACHDCELFGLCPWPGKTA